MSSFMQVPRIFAGMSDHTLQTNGNLQGLPEGRWSHPGSMAWECNLRAGFTMSSFEEIRSIQ